MEPILVELGPTMAVRSYGLFAGLGLAVGGALAYRAGVRAGLDRKRLIDLILWVVVCSLLGAKLLLIAVEWPVWTADPWTWVELFGRPMRWPRALVVWQGGLVYWGGVIAGLAAGVIYSRRKGLPLGLTADAVAPTLALGHVWGRMGCALAGCCFGKAGGGALGVRFGLESQAFEAHRAAGLLQPPFAATYPLHPVQLYEAAAELALAAALLFWVTPRRRWAGQVALSYVLGYGALRFFLEIFRGDRARGFLGEPVALVELNRALGVDGGSPTVLSVSQMLSLVMILIACWVYPIAARRARPEGRK